MQLAFVSRPTGYKVGVVSLYIATVLFLVGNFSPQWLQYSRTQRNVPFDHGIYHYKEERAHSSALAGCGELEENGTVRSQGGLLGQRQYRLHKGFNVNFFSISAHGCGVGFYVESVAGAWVRVCQAFEAIGALALLLACIYTIRVNFFRAEIGPRRVYVEIATVASGVLGLLGTIIFAGKMGGDVRGSDFYLFAWSLFFTMVVSVVLIVVGVVIAVFNRPQNEMLS
ncbi:hypothetical protein ACOMHN_028936 [Nucella lapillus]